ncbi:MAG: GH1 family beta-glucosidase [Eubacteriales bacterium]|nr:GH1 family beta-glucosidase [Eubacteriales bacterium]
MGFRKDFVWGAATASYQVEGAAYENGKGLNIWDVFCKEPGKIYEGHSGDVACDQYHRYQEDVRTMKEMGIRAYRFSLSWARIMPEGTGRVNEKGLAYYDALIDALLENGIEPYVTLYHWDLPYALQLRGGWMNPESPKWFYDYAAVVAEHFSDRVKKFFTINEPQCAAGLGYLTGEHAPGLKVGAYDFFHVWQNLLLAHGRAVQALREHAKGPVEIGAAPCSALYYPETESAADIEAARRAMFTIAGDTPNDAVWNIAFWSDPVFFGHYPEGTQERFGKLLPPLSQEEWKVISSPLDFYGQNMYNAVMVRADEQGNPVRVKRAEGFPKTAIQWPVTPECMYWGPKFLYERYHKPFYITENGMSSHDWVSLDGRVHDAARVDFLHRYLREYRRAAADGVDARGYFAWSSHDNFEWSYGYSERFGLIYVDYATQKRTVKDSGYFYRETAAANGENL